MVESQAEGGRWLVTLCLQAGRREKKTPGLAYFLFYFLSGIPWNGATRIPGGPCLFWEASQKQDPDRYT